MCTFVTRIMPPSGQAIPALPPPPELAPRSGFAARLPRGEERAQAPAGGARQKGGAEKAPTKEKLNKLFLFSRR